MDTEQIQSYIEPKTIKNEPQFYHDQCRDDSILLLISETKGLFWGG